MARGIVNPVFFQIAPLFFTTAKRYRLVTEVFVRLVDLVADDIRKAGLVLADAIDAAEPPDRQRQPAHEA